MGHVTQPCPTNKLRRATWCQNSSLNTISLSFPLSEHFLDASGLQQKSIRVRPKDREMKKGHSPIRWRSWEWHRGQSVAQKKHYNYSRESFWHHSRKIVFASQLQFMMHGKVFVKSQGMHRWYLYISNVISLSIFRTWKVSQEWTEDHHQERKMCFLFSTIWAVPWVICNHHHHHHNAEL